MLKKILKDSTFILFSLFITLTIIFSGLSPVKAVQMDADSNDNNPMGIVIEESSDPIDSSKTSSIPDLGDDQAFPFIPGFGKNSGKD